MKYDFRCLKCVLKFVVERDMDDSHLPCPCEECGNPMERVYTPPMIKTQGESIPYFHPSLGCIVKSDTHAKQLAKAKGWTEVGNEDIKKYGPKPKRHDYDFNDYFDDTGVSI